MRLAPTRREAPVIAWRHVRPHNAHCQQKPDDSRPISIRTRHADTSNEHVITEMGRGDTTTPASHRPTHRPPRLVPARASQSRIAPSLAAEKPRSISKLTTARGRCPLWMDHGWCWLSRRQGSCFSFVSPAQRDGPAPRAGSRGGGRPERNVCVGGWGGLMQVRRGLTGPQSSRPGLPGLFWSLSLREPPFLLLRLA